MKAGGPARHRGAGPWRTALCGLACAWSVLPGSARAELYTVEASSDARLDTNDNVNLQPQSPGTVNTLSLSTSVGASRQTENSATRVNAAATALKQWGRGGNDRVDGRVGVTQTYRDAVNTLSATAQYSQDFNNTVQNADVAVDRGQRRTTSVSASWGRLLTERLSTNAQVAASETRYGQQATAGSDFRNASVSASVSYDVTETDTVTVRATHSNYRSSGTDSQSATNDISVGVSRALSERVSGSLFLGAYRTESRTPRFSIACPLAVALCDAGLVQFIVVSDTATTTGTGLIYSSTYRYLLNETTSVSFATDSQQTPSGAGAVARNNSLSLGLNHSFSETLSASLLYAQSRSTYKGSTVGGNAEQRTFVVSMSQQLAPDLSVQSSYQWTQARNLGASSAARSNSVGVALKYDWSRIEATR